MARTEGVLSLMKGFSASMLRELAYSGMRLGSYEYFKDVCVSSSKAEWSMFIKNTRADCTTVRGARSAERGTG